MSIKTIVFIGLLVFVPISIAAHLLHWGALTVFITAGLAIVPLAAWMGTATEEIAVVAGPSLGGLLNATFGNATELIIALAALNAGLIDVVKASITGSIVGNLLLVMGLSMLLGGLRHKEQEFQSVVARVNASSMNLAVIALLLPTAMKYTSEGILLLLNSGAVGGYSDRADCGLLSDAAVLHANAHLPLRRGSRPSKSWKKLLKKILAEPEPKVNVKLWVAVLLAATIAVAIESELLVDSLEEATTQLGLTELFTGVILLPIVGNAAEHATAVTVAMKNKMDLSVSVAVGSSLQIALFVAPVLVIAGWVLGKPMDLDFNPFELVAVAVSVLIANSISSDGRSNWLEGTLLIAAYAVLSLAFYFHPVMTS
jgi:Ca2+:H+ antiporter